MTLSLRVCVLFVGLVALCAMTEGAKVGGDMVSFKLTRTYTKGEIGTLPMESKFEESKDTPREYSARYYGPGILFLTITEETGAPECTLTKDGGYEVCKGCDFDREYSVSASDFPLDNGGAIEPPKERHENAEYILTCSDVKDGTTQVFTINLQEIALRCTSYTLYDEDDNVIPHTVKNGAWDKYNKILATELQWDPRYKDKIPNSKLRCNNDAFPKGSELPKDFEIWFTWKTDMDDGQASSFDLIYDTYQTVSPSWHTWSMQTITQEQELYNLRVRCNALEAKAKEAESDAKAVHEVKDVAMFERVDAGKLDGGRLLDGATDPYADAKAAKEELELCFRQLATVEEKIARTESPEFYKGHPGSRKYPFPSEEYTVPCPNPQIVYFWYADIETQAQLCVVEGPGVIANPSVPINVYEGAVSGTPVKLSIGRAPTADLTCDIAPSVEGQVTINGRSLERFIVTTKCETGGDPPPPATGKEVIDVLGKAAAKRRLLSVESPAMICADQQYEIMVHAIEDDSAEGESDLTLNLNCTSDDQGYAELTVDPIQVKVHDNDFGVLKWLWTSGSPISPPFDRSVKTYTSEIPYSIGSIHVGCFPSSSGHSCLINGVAVASGSTGKVDCQQGVTSVIIKVVDSTSKVWTTYSLSVTRPETPKFGAPVAVQSVGVVAHSTTAKLSWTHVVANPLVSRYRLRRRTNGVLPESWTVVYDGELTPAADGTVSVSLSDLPAATADDYDLISVNELGESPVYNFVVTTKVLPAKPVITSVTPQSTGPAGGTVVTIKGEHLGHQAGSVSVNIAGLACQKVAWIDSTHITCVTAPSTNSFPTGTPGTGQVIVKTEGGSSDGNFAFEYTGPLPVNIVPKIAQKDARYTRVEITVKGIDDLEQIASVNVGMATCVEGSLTLKKPNSVFCTVPAPVATTGIPHGTAVTAGVEVKLKNGQFGVAKNLFTHYAMAIPGVSSISPSHGSFLGATSVVIEGSNFGTDPTAITAVAIGGVECRQVRLISTSKITCITGPSGHTKPSAKADTVTVTTKEGGDSTGTVTFQYSEALPVLKDIKPRVNDHAGGGTVTIKGAYLGTDPKDIEVSIGGRPCAPVTLATDFELQCTAPPSGETGDASQVTEAQGTKRHVRVTNKKAEGFNDLPFRYGEVCPSPCPWNSECVKKQCLCLPGYAGDQCESRNVLVSKASNHLDEDGTPATFTVQLATAPIGFVMVLLASNDTSEGVVRNPSVLRFNTDDWNQPRVVTVDPLPDTLRDGNVTFAIKLLVSSDDEMYENGPSLPSVICVNDDRRPRIISVLPQTLPTEGGNLTLRGRELDKVVTVNLINPDTTARHPVKILSRVRKTSASTLQRAAVTSRTKLMQASTVTTQAVETSEDEETIIVYVDNMDPGYTHFELINNNGGREELPNHILFTNDCPNPGEHGVEGSCQTCPACAECPGGDRLWPKEGCWNSGETSGFVGPCEPAYRCKGGKEAGCAPGYSGEFCARCAEGYTPTGNQCVACPSSSDVFWYVICDVIVWCLFGIAAVFIRDRMTFSYVVAGVRMLQLLGGVGRMSTNSLPDWLQTTYTILHLFSGDYEFLKPDCFSRPSYLMSFFGGLFYNFITFVPTFSFVLIGGLISYFYHSIVVKSEKSVIQERKEWYFDRFVRSVMIFLAVSYLPVATRVFEAVSCRSVEGTGNMYLITKEYVQCFTSDHTIVFVLSIMLILGMVAAFPAFYLFFLTRRQDRIFTDERFMEKCNFVYELFGEHYWNYFGLDFVIAATIAAGNTFLSPLGALQMAACSLVILIKLGLIAWRKPYIDGLTNIIQFCITLALLFAVNINFLASQGLNPSVLSFGGTVFIICTAIAIVIIAGLIIKALLWPSEKEPAFPVKAVDFVEGEELEMDEIVADKIFHTLSYKHHSWHLEQASTMASEDDVSVSVASADGLDNLSTGTDDRPMRRGIGASLLRAPEPPQRAHTSSLDSSSALDFRHMPTLAHHDSDGEGSVRSYASLPPTHDMSHYSYHDDDVSAASFGSTQPVRSLPAMPPVTRSALSSVTVSPETSDDEDHHYADRSVDDASHSSSHFNRDRTSGEESLGAAGAAVPLSMSTTFDPSVFE